MSNKIDTVQIEDVDNTESNKEITKLSDIYWKDYLKDKNYNKDLDKMCELCVKDQIKKYGSQTIICKGLNKAEAMLGEAAKDMDKEELAEFDILYNPFDYMDRFLDYENPNRNFEHRFYQKMILGCSARYKVVRMGRRTGKSQSIAMLAVHRASLEKTRILLVSPYAVQTEEIISTIKDLCTRLPENPLVSSKASPAHKLVFANGTVLMGFTAATNGDSIRGQPADLIILDECLVGNTLITMSDGTKKQIKDIKIGDRVLSNFNTIDLVLNSKSTGFKQTYKYTFDNGSVLEATPNHPVKDVNGFVSIHNCEYVESCTGLHKFNGRLYTKLLCREDASIQEVYNLTVDNNHTYIANDLLNHNCDDIPEKAINSIMGIKMQNPEVEVWRSGTPKGQRNLYRAEQDIMAKSFHFPSFVIPKYSDQMDASLRSDYGDGVGYIEEVLAEISSANNAVFQNIFISRALNKVLRISASDVLEDRSRFIVFLGVDWNHDKVGSRLLVIAYDKIVRQFHIIDKEIVAIEGFTQHAAVEKIITLNRKYNCDHVFVDQGFGATQIADLKSFAMAKAGTIPKGHPDLKLLDVTPVDYGSSTVIRDPVTGNEYKTPTKQLAVATAVEMFEKDLITLCKKEHNDIIQQLRNYVEVSRNKGRIVYGYISKKIGDHDLDALMIGIFGMKRIYSSLFVNEANTALLKFAEKQDIGETPLKQSDDLATLSFGNKSTSSSSRVSGFSRSDRTNGFRKRGRGGF